MDSSCLSFVLPCAPPVSLSDITLDGIVHHGLPTSSPLPLSSLEYGLWAQLTQERDGTGLVENWHVRTMVVGSSIQGAESLWIFLHPIGWSLAKFFLRLVCLFVLFCHVLHLYCNNDLPPCHQMCWYRIVVVSYIYIDLPPAYQMCWYRIV